MMIHALLGPLGHQVLVRLTTCLALLTFCGFVTADPGLALSPISTAFRRTVQRCRKLVQSMGLMRQPRHRADHQDRQQNGEQSRSQNSAPFSLNAIELALLAELSLETAQAHDELAADSRRRAETRRDAQARAAILRERAHLFELEARRLNAQPLLSPPAMPSPAAFPTALERRRHDRRTGSRRRNEDSAVVALGGCERRTQPDRRKRERRGGGAVVT